jgi:hypothetical protein
LEMGVSQTTCWGWHWGEVLPISASQVARIIGMSHWCLAFFLVLRLQLRVFTSSHSTSSIFVLGIFKIVSQTICLGWLWTVILLLSASWVARITGVSHQHPAGTGFDSPQKNWGHGVELTAYTVPIWGVICS